MKSDVASCGIQTSYAVKFPNSIDEVSNDLNEVDSTKELYQEVLPWS